MSLGMLWLVVTLVCATVVFGGCGLYNRRVEKEDQITAVAEAAGVLNDPEADRRNRLKVHLEDLAA